MPATEKHGLLWVTGLLNGTQPRAHYVADTLSRYGWQVCHCGALVRYGQGQALMASRLALKIAELCEACLEEKVQS